MVVHNHTHTKANKVTDTIKESKLRQLLDSPYNYKNENMSGGQYLHADVVDKV